MLPLLHWLFNKKQKGKKLLLLECQIHGSHYYQCLNLVKENKLKKGEQLLLRREPHNEYDNFAIEVYNLDQQKLGYVPKHLNQVIATLMDQRCEITAMISSIFTTEWEPVNIRLYLQTYD